MLNSGFRPGAMPGFINNPHYMFNQRYSEKKSANKINGIASYGIYGNVSKSMTGFGSPYDYSNLFPAEDELAKGAGPSFASELAGNLAKLKAGVGVPTTKTPASVGPQKFAALDIESLISEFMPVLDVPSGPGPAVPDFDKDRFELGKVITKANTPTPIAVAISDPEGKSMGYTYMDDLAGFDIQEYRKRGSVSGTNPLINFEFKPNTLADESIRKLMGLGATDPIPSNYDEVLMSRLNLKRSGAGFSASMTKSQLDYVNSTVRRHESGYFLNSVTEGLATEGSKGVKSHGELVHNVIEMLESTRAQTDTLVGFNILGFDLPKLQDLADASGFGDRFRKVSSSFKVVDLMQVYKNKLEAMKGGLDIFPPETMKHSLDVAANTYANKDAHLKNLLNKRGTHAAGRDNAITARLYELMNDSSVEVTMEDHMRSVGRVFRNLKKKRKAGGYVGDEEFSRAAAAAEKATEWIKTHVPKTAKGAKAKAASAAAASATSATSGTKTTAKAAASGFLDSLMSKAGGKNLLIGAGIAAGIFGLRYATEDMESPLDTLNSSVNYLGRRRAERKDWISASALQLEGNDRFYRLIDPALESKHERKTDSEKRRTAQVQEVGNRTHIRVQELLEAQGLGEREYYVEDTKNKVFGYVDFMLQGGIPLEIKTTDYNKWEGMTAPKEEHVRQANFDTMATDSPYAYIMYVPRDMPEKQKTFLVYRDPSRYSKDVTEAREIQRQYGDSVDSSAPELSGFRPLSSLFSRVENDRVANVDIGYNRSKIRDQKSRLSGAGGSYNKLGSARHSNELSRGSGGTTYG